jgi:transposase
VLLNHDNIEVYAWCEPTDMRKGFEGLSALVRNEMKMNELSGALFLFVNRRRTHAKVLHFDGTGLCVYAKRLERHRFVALWKLAKFDTVSLSKQELELFLQGSHFVTRFRVAPQVMTDKDLAVGSKT